MREMAGNACETYGRRDLIHPREKQSKLVFCLDNRLGGLYLRRLWGKELKRKDRFARSLGLCELVFNMHCDGWGGGGVRQKLFVKVALQSDEDS